MKTEAQDVLHPINYRPIGVMHSEYSPETGAPRQGALIPDNSGIIEIFPEFRSALESLDMFEYIIVIYHFDRVTSWDPVVEPPASDHDYQFGLFATRSPRRPNPIGFSVIKLEKIEAGKLWVSGIDFFDGTPVLDIKPYLPSIDCLESSRNREVEHKLGHHDEVFIRDSSFYK
ncbi:MAG: tRNA (N6-threonylcarbamoyladenosine(37)-N6)-methyltransferase TrmO [Bacteroidota bacterium]